MERVFREAGKDAYADQFKGFDWQTEEDAFMDGYHQNAGGGEFVTYERLRAMGTNGFQEPATGFEDGKIVGTKRLYTDGKFGAEDGKATFIEDAVARPAGAGQGGAEGRATPSSSTTAAPTTSGRPPISTRRTTSSMDRWPYPFIEMNPDDMAELGVAEGDLVEVYNENGSTQAMVYPTPTAKPKRDLHAVRLSDRRAGQRHQRTGSTSSSSRTTSRPGPTSGRSPTRRKASGT